MYTIFKNDSSIFLTDDLKKTEKIDFYYFNDVNLRSLLFQAENRKMHIILYHQDLDWMWHEFLMHFKIIEAAGGLVQNSNDDLLFIYRNSKWDLPKGKIEKDEKIENAALREVREECGIDELMIDAFIEKTYHVYQEKGNDILKITHWYHMKSNAHILKPQLEEDITEVAWKNKNETRLALENTYPNIKMLIENYHFNVNQRGNLL